MLLQSNDTPLNILCSFAYLYKNKALATMFCDLHRRGIINGMIDSGAYTKMHSRQQQDYINVDTYCEWLSGPGIACEKYVTMDKVGDHEQTKRNYELMVSRGFRPMYVFTIYDTEWSYLMDTLNVNPHCCIAGGVVKKSDWIKQRYQTAYRMSDGRAKIHGLGYVTAPMMFQLPLTSVDSSTWNTASSMGNLLWFDGGKIHSIHRSRILHQGRSVPEYLRRFFVQTGVTVDDLRTERNWIGEKSIARFETKIAYLRYQRYAWRHGLRLFLATGSDRQLAELIYMSEHLNTITYEQYTKDGF